MVLRMIINCNNIGVSRGVRASKKLTKYLRHSKKKIIL